jgi:hypothetical protein
MGLDRLSTRPHPCTMESFRKTKQILDEFRLRAADGGGHDEADAEWIGIRGLLRGLNEMPFERPTPDWPIARGLATLRAFSGVFSYYQLVMKVSTYRRLYKMEI